jgi:uncharacterized protein with HEPN domain
MRNDRERLNDILEAMTKIEKYAKRGENVFKHNELVQNWILRHLQILGEASWALSDELRKQYPAVPWSDIIGMRNILVHDYFGIDLKIVWSVIENDLPKLKRQVKTMIREKKAK